MKTILIILGGAADRISLSPNGETPLAAAVTPSLDALAQISDIGYVRTVPYYLSMTAKNAVFNILGYDQRRGDITETELMELGFNADFPSGPLPFFNIPYFSGHGSMITTSPLIRGIARLASLTPVDIYSPGASDEDIYDVMASEAIRLSEKQEFVGIYVDEPAQAARLKNYEAKIKAIEAIDSHLISPIADYVWRAGEPMVLAIIPDMAVSCYTGAPVEGKVPAMLYNNEREGIGMKKFCELEAIHFHDDFPTIEDLMLELCYPYTPVAMDFDSEKPF